MPLEPAAVQRIKDAISAAETLQGVVGLLPSYGVGMRDLMACGLWFREVEVISDRREPNSFPVSKGERGSICWHYPVSGSLFDFAVEAPVQGLPSAPHAVIGIPWHLLRLIGAGTAT